MANWNCWSGWAKKLFNSDSRAKSRKFKEPKKPRKWGCSINKRFKLRQYPTYPAPNRTLTEAIEEKRKLALNVAIATAAAAEAAEVVCLTAGASHSFHHLSKEDRNFAAIKMHSADIVQESSELSIPLN